MTGGSRLLPFALLVLVLAVGAALQTQRLLQDPDESSEAESLTAGLIDAESEVLTFAAVRHFHEEGFSGSSFLPVYVGYDSLTPAREELRDGVYTHFLPGPEYSLFVLTSLFGDGPGALQRIRLFPALLVLLALVFFVGTAQREALGDWRWGAPLLAGILGASPAVYEASISLYGHSYSNACLLVGLGLGMLVGRSAPEQDSPRARHGLLFAGFTLGLLSNLMLIEAAFATLVAPAVGWLLCPRRGGLRLLAKLSLAILAGEVLIFLIHFGQVAWHLNSISLAFADQTGSAALRAVNHGNSLTRLFGDFSQGTKQMFHLGLPALLALSGLVALCPGPVSRRRRCLALSSALLAGLLFGALFPEHWANHQYRLPRLLLPLYAALAVGFLIPLAHFARSQAQWPGGPERLWGAGIRWVTRHPRTILTLVIVCTLGTGWIARDVGVEHDLGVLLDSRSENRRFLDEHEATFGPMDRTTLLIVEGGSLSQRERTSLGAQLAQRILEQNPEVENVTASSDRYVVLALRLDPHFSDPNRAGSILKLIDQSTRDFIQDQALPLQHQLGGLAATRVASLHTTLEETRRLVPVACLLLVLALVLLFRSVTAASLALAGAGAGIVLTGGLIGLGNGSLQPLTRMVPILLVVIAVSDCTHLLHRFVRLLDSGRDRHQAAVETLRSTGGACLLATTIASLTFLALLGSPTAIVQDFGRLTAVGLALVLLLNLSLLPACLLLFRARPRGLSPRMAPLLDRLSGALVQRRIAAFVFVAGISLTTGAGFLSYGTPVDFSWRGLLDEGDRVSQGNRILDEELSGMLPVEVHLVGNPGDFERPEVLAAVEDLEAALGREGFASPTGPAGLLRRLAASETDIETSRTTRAELSRLPGLAEEFGDQGAVPLVDPERSQARILTSCPDRGGRWLTERQDRIEAAGDALLESFGISTRVTGAAVGTASGVKATATSLLQALLFALLVLVAAIGVFFRSLRMALAGLLPTVLPLLLTLAWLGTGDRSLALSSILSLIIPLGVASNTTTHLLARYREALPSSASHAEAIRRATRASVGAAGLVAVALAPAFLVLATARLPALATTGWIGLGGLAVSLLCALVFTPASLALLCPGTAGSGSQDGPAEA
ncbi:MAG: MMPL family transporter [Myxococcota bacterium]|nr:MMPL family transporter [Myxococcota bacterium]